MISAFFTGLILAITLSTLYILLEAAWRNLFYVLLLVITVITFYELAPL